MAGQRTHIAWNVSQDSRFIFRDDAAFDEDDMKALPNEYDMIKDCIRRRKASGIRHGEGKYNYFSDNGLINIDLDWNRYFEIQVYFRAKM